MKRAILTMALMFCATTATAYSTTESAIFCVSKDLYTQMTAAIAAQDKAKLEELYKSQSCGAMPAGIKLSIFPDGVSETGPWRVLVHLPSGSRLEVWIAYEGINILN